MLLRGLGLFRVIGFVRFCFNATGELGGAAPLGEGCGAALSHCQTWTYMKTYVFFRHFRFGNDNKRSNSHPPAFGGRVDGFREGKTVF